MNANGPAPGPPESADGLALSIRNLTKVYQRSGGGFLPWKGRSSTVVDDLNLGVKRGEIYGFLGLNGAGKTTTIKVVLGLVPATTGQVEIFGRDATFPDARLRIGFAPERSAFYDFLTASETLEMLGQLGGMDIGRIRPRIAELLSTVALDGEGDTPVRNFSKGMQQRLGIAQSLIADPDLLIFDEPTTGLDPFGRKLFKELVLKLKREGKTVFFSSHQIPDVQEICDRVGVIHRGKLVLEKPVSEIVGEGTSLEQKFMSILGEVDPAARNPIQLD